MWKKYTPSIKTNAWKSVGDQFFCERWGKMFSLKDNDRAADLLQCIHQSVSKILKDIIGMGKTVVWFYLIYKCLGQNEQGYNLSFKFMLRLLKYQPYYYLGNFLSFECGYKLVNKCTSYGSEGRVFFFLFFAGLKTTSSHKYFYFNWSCEVPSYDNPCISHNEP